MLLITLYTHQLSELSRFLEAIGECRWSNRVAAWVDELKDLYPNSEQVRKHVARTRLALASMRSIGGIVIARRKGANKTLSNNQVGFLGRKLAQLIQALRWTAYASEESAALPTSR